MTKPFPLGGCTTYARDRRGSTAPHKSFRMRFSRFSHRYDGGPFGGVESDRLSF